MAFRPLCREDLEAMGIPQAYWSCRADQMQPGPDTRAFWAYLRGFPAALRIPAGAYIHGDAGRGKTGAAVVALKVARSHGLQGLFVNVPSHIERLRAKEAIPQYDLETSFAKALRTFPLVVLDDLRTQDLREGWFGVEALSKLLRQRRDRRAATIITSRVSFVDLSRAQPELADEMGELRPIHLAGSDLRVRQSNLVAQAFGDDTSDQ